MAGIFGGSGSTTTSQQSNSSTNNDFAPWFDQLTQQLIGNAQGLTNLQNNPYPFYQGQMFAPFNSTQNSAFSGVQNAPSQTAPYFNSATSTLNSALPQAGGYFNAAGSQPTALQASSPFLGAASQTWNQPGVSQSYLNPYIGGALSYGNQLASQNFLQNTLPGINNEFVASGGGLGSKQYGRTADWALKNFNNTLTGQNLGALSNQFNASGNQFTSDQNRLAGLAGTAGNAAATSAGTLSGIGSAFGNLGIGGAGAFGNLGSASNSTNLANLNALLQTGNQQQQQAQNPLNFAFQQQQAANQYPFQLTGWGSGIAGATPVPTSSNTNSQSYGTTTGTSSPSLAGGILGGLSSLVGLGQGIFGGGSGGGSGLLGSISSLFGGGAGGVSNIAGGSAAAGGDILSLLPFLGAKKGGYFGLDAPSKPSFYEPADGHYARGGYFGMDAPSRPAFYERPDSPRQGYRSPLQMAAGGYAPVVRAARQDIRRDIDAAQREQARPMFSGTQSIRRPLRMRRGGYFADGGDVDSDKAMITKAVHKHERILHKGSPLTALDLARGGFFSGMRHVYAN